MENFRLRRTLPALAVAAAALFTLAPCYSQNVTFGLSSATTGSPGSTVKLAVSMDTSAGISPAGVEWTISYPRADFSSASVAAGPVAMASNKRVECDVTTGAATCVLWGDNNVTMANGVAAVVSLVISPSTLSTASQVQLSTPMAASPSAFPIDSSASGAVVSILQPAGLNGFTCVPAAIAYPGVSTCTVDLTAPAPPGGAIVLLSASDPDVTLPASVTIPRGGISTRFEVAAKRVPAPAPVDLTASYLGVKEGFGIRVR